MAMINTCALYGGSTYVNNWITVSVLVVLLSLLGVAIAYTISNFLSNQTREKIKGAARSEITQAFLSIVIIAILLGTAAAACNITSSLSNTYTGTKMSPFTYATYYVGNLSTNTGLKLLTSLYSTSVTYSVEATVLNSLGGLFRGQSGFGGLIKKIFAFSTIVNVAPSPTIQSLGDIFNSLSGMYLTIFAPLVTVAIGLLFIQFITLPLLQYTAFTVILPVALIMRSLAFMGNSIRSASNAVLAIAIAAYIIYPLMIAFNSYAIAWIFSAQNPSYQYLTATYKSIPITGSTFFNQSLPAATGFFGNGWKVVFPYLNKFVSGQYSITSVLSLPFQVITQMQIYVVQIARFLFASIIMVLIDLSVTIGFATGLTKALNAGIEGAGNFWGGI